VKGTNAGRNTPPLPGWIEDAYQPIERHLWADTKQNSVTHQQATQLISKANPDFNSADIDHALDYLLNRGWLYTVDERLFVTEYQNVGSTESDN